MGNNTNRRWDGLGEHKPAILFMHNKKGLTMNQISIELNLCKHFISKVITDDLFEKSKRQVPLLQQISNHEKILFANIKMEQNNPSYENRKRVSELQLFYCRFLAI